MVHPILIKKTLQYTIPSSGSENSRYKEFSMKIYKISVIVLNLIIISSFSYADNNLSKEKNSKQITLTENRLDELLTIIRKAPNPLPKDEKVKIVKKVVTIYPTDRATIEDINRKINYIEKQNRQREAKIKNFEEELKAYQKRIENFDD
jgi:peptidoglycan hydrolase CwlO-like protein